MKGTVVSLFDRSGVMVEPWLEAGYDAWIVDIAHPYTEVETHLSGGRLSKVKADLTTPDALYKLPIPGRIVFAAAFPPCDHLAVSGAAWFKGKGLRKLARSIDMFATAAEFCEWTGAPYMIENPMSTIATYWRSADHEFHPFHYTFFEPEDNYTKTTWLWTGGGFVMPTPCQAIGLTEPDTTRIHWESPGPDRAARRSVTPRGFARAVYEANRPDKKEVAA